MMKEQITIKNFMNPFQGAQSVKTNKYKDITSITLYNFQSDIASSNI